MPEKDQQMLTAPREAARPRLFWAVFGRISKPRRRCTGRLLQSPPTRSHTSSAERVTP
jgi:hypothetical protein